MARFKATPPSFSAGKMGKETKKVRPIPGLSEDERARARTMRVEMKMDFPEIASAMGKPLAEVEKSLSNIRMPADRPTRMTINVTCEDGEFIKKLLLPGEPIWKGFHRLIEERFP